MNRSNSSKWHFVTFVAPLLVIATLNACGASSGSQVPPGVSSRNSLDVLEAELIDRVTQLVQDYGGPLLRSSSGLNSKPFEGPGNKVTDLSASVNGTTATLQWTEKNKGDFNNSGFVSIEDISALAEHFWHTSPYVGNVPVDEMDAIVDGNEDGIVNVQEISVLAENFFSRIAGYEVFLLPIPSLDEPVREEDFQSLAPIDNPLDTLNPRPTVPRTYFYVDNAPPKRPIVYSTTLELTPGFYAVSVRTFSVPDEDYSAYNVPFSNIYKFEVEGSQTNRPPQWVNTVGLTDAEPLDGGARLTFGDSTDPDGDETIYRIYFQPGETVDPGSPDAVALDFPHSGFSGSPPFSVDIVREDLVNGFVYAFMVRILDDKGMEEDPPNSVILTVVPTSSVPNPFPWPYLNKDEFRSSTARTSSLKEPITEIWRESFRSAGSGFNQASPVLDNQNVYVASVDGSIWAFEQETGISPSPSFPYSLSSTTLESTTALYGEFIIQGADNRFDVLEFSGGVVQPKFSFPLENPLVVQSSPLVLRGVVYVGSNEGRVYAFALNGFELWRQDLGSSKISSSPSTDGSSIFVANDDGFVFRLDTNRDGSVTDVSNDLGSITFSTPIAYPPGDPTYVIVGTDFTGDGTQGVYRLNALDLKDALRIPTNRGVRCTPLLIERGDGKRIIVFGTAPLTPPSDPETRIHAYDLDTGELVWETQPMLNIGGVVSSPVASADRIFVGTTSGKLYVLDFFGEVKQVVTDIGGAIYSTPAINDGMLFVTNNMEEIIAYRASPTS